MLTAVGDLSANRKPELPADSDEAIADQAASPDCRGSWVRVQPFGDEVLVKHGTDPDTELTEA